MTGGNDSRAGARHHRGIFEHPRGSGIWYVRYFDEQGKKHREKVGPKGLAQKVYYKRKTEIQERRFFPERFKQRDIPLAAMIDEYLRRKRSTLKAHADWERIGRCWKNAPETKGKMLREVRPKNIEDYRERRRGQGRAEATCNRELTFLRSVYNVAIEDAEADPAELPITNPVLSRLFYKETNQRVRYLTDDEETRLRVEMPDDEDWAKVLIAMNSGFRRGNQFALEWDTDVRLDTRMLRAARSRSGEDYWVPINDELLAILRALPSRLRSRWVFPNATDTGSIDPKNFKRRVFDPALTRAGIPDLRWHDLRHTFASRLRIAGVDLATIRDLLGHKTLAMTERYAHVTPSHTLEAVQKLSRRAAAPAGDSATDTRSEPTPAAALGGSGKVLPERGVENDGRCWDRTSDPRLVRPMLSR